MLVNLDASNTVHICLIVTWAVSLCLSAGQSRNHCGHGTMRHRIPLKGSSKIVSVKCRSRVFRRLSRYFLGARVRIRLSTSNHNIAMC